MTGLVTVVVTGVVGVVSVGLGMGLVTMVSGGLVTGVLSIVSEVGGVMVNVGSITVGLVAGGRVGGSVVGRVSVEDGFVDGGFVEVGFVEEGFVEEGLVGATETVDSGRSGTVVGRVLGTGLVAGRSTVSTGRVRAARALVDSSSPAANRADWGSDRRARPADSSDVGPAGVGATSAISPGLDPASGLDPADRTTSHPAARTTIARTATRTAWSRLRTPTTAI